LWVKCCKTHRGAAEHLPGRLAARYEVGPPFNVYITVDLHGAQQDPDRTAMAATASTRPGVALLMGTATA
jgi:hypothetical protein